MVLVVNATKQITLDHNFFIYSQKPNAYESLIVIVIVAVVVIFVPGNFMTALFDHQANGVNNKQVSVQLSRQAVSG